MQLAAIIFGVFTAIVCGFQLALAAGAPWGIAAMGGKFPGKFPPAIRVLALVQCLLLTGMAAIILSKAGILFDQFQSSAAKLSWIVVTFGGLTLVGNLATQSKLERIIWAPVAAILVICSLIVALG